MTKVLIGATMRLSREFSSEAKCGRSASAEASGERKAAAAAPSRHGAVA